MCWLHGGNYAGLLKARHVLRSENLRVLDPKSSILRPTRIRFEDFFIDTKSYGVPAISNCVSTYLEAFLKGLSGRGLDLIR
jgi:hypothetical protein